MSSGHEGSLDQQVRAAAFRFLAEHSQRHGEEFDRATLTRGFDFRGERVRLVGPQGIFKPKILRDYPLSILTVASRPGVKRPYDDGFQSDGTVLYRYRGTDPQFHENVRLRQAMRDRVPLIYFHGTVPGRYLASWPAYVINDDPGGLTFVVDVDGGRLTSSGELGGEPDLVRRYGVRTTRQRLHQQAFRTRVLRAYREHCAICRLRHPELLDAAHIIPDSDLDGEPRVSNGISLCKLHHAAFDVDLIGIRPDLTIEVRRDVLDEKDGPMLRHGLQGMHQTKILVPGKPDWRPDKRALEQRYESFRIAGGP